MHSNKANADMIEEYAVNRKLIFVFFKGKK